MSTASVGPLDDDLPGLLTWDFGDRLRKIRRAVAGLSQPEFAAKLGVHLKSYSAYEAGTNLPSAPKMLALARRIEILTGVPAAWTLGVDHPVVSNDTPRANAVTSASTDGYEQGKGRVVVPLRRRDQRISAAAGPDAGLNGGQFYAIGVPRAEVG
jgi:transcriptional regulator with XRE-family HTH domain